MATRKPKEAKKRKSHFQPGNKAAVGHGPSKWDDRLIRIAEGLSLDGKTDREIARILDVSEMTIHRWKLEHPSFLLVTRRAKATADSAVVASLWQRSIGYSHPAEKIVVVNGKVVRVPYVQHYPPDAAAMKMWLYNRQSQSWKDHQVETPDDGKLDEILQALSKNYEENK